MADILGTNWPKRAGPAAMILNNKSKTDPSNSVDLILKPASPILKIEPEEPLRKFILLSFLQKEKKYIIIKN